MLREVPMLHPIGTNITISSVRTQFRADFLRVSPMSCTTLHHDNTAVRHENPRLHHDMTQVEHVVDQEVRQG